MQVVLGKYMRLLLIALDLCLVITIIMYMIMRILPIYEPFFWIGTAVEVGLALFAFRYWMRGQKTTAWNQEKTLAVVLIVIAIAWPSVVRYTPLDFLKSAAPSDLLFFCAALTLLIYSSFLIKNLPGRSKTRP
jgi:hypothetical protein